MENNILDQEQSQPTTIQYAGFWERVGAGLIDLLIFIPLFILSFYNLMHIKNLVLALVLSFVWIIYKIYMEGAKGATIGKRVMKIVVVNGKNEKINMDQSIARNSLYIIYTLLGLITTVMVFNANGFEDSTSFFEVSQFQSENGFSAGDYLGLIMVIISILWIVFDKHKQSLHDKIGKTYCAIRS